MADGSVESKADDQRALMARALEEIKRLRKENAKLSARDSIAVVGIGCRFPGLSDGIEKFWDLLDQGRSGIVDVPEDRWDKHTLVDPDPQAPGKIVSARGGYLKDGLAFD
ncbi:MAG: beta-ketoacyl synthase N-terminal-like domain-containing protein, partial [Halieaceae bacterium]